MVIDMKELGKRIRKMDMEDLNMEMVVIMRENGRII